MTSQSGGKSEGGGGKSGGGNILTGEEGDKQGVGKSSQRSCQA